MAAKMTSLALFLTIFLLCSSMAVLGNQTDISFVYQSFNSTSNLTFVDNAMVRKPGVVRLTNDTKWVIGRMFYPTPLQLKQNNTVSPFSTTFVMAMVPPQGAEGSGHGIAFLLSPTTSTTGTSSAEYLGLFNDTSTGQPYNHIFAVEFDTSQNVEFADPSANHVGLDLNSLTSNATHYAGYFDGNNKFVNVTLKSGRNIQVWIDYSPIEDQINVTLAPAGMQKPKRPVLSMKNLNLSGIIEDRVYVGFSSATGNFVAEHYILAWSFATGGRPAEELDAAGLPSLMWRRRKSIYRTPTFIALVCLAAVFVLLAAVTAKWYKNRETVEEWEKEFWPHRFSYRDLRAATKGFSEREVLGAGGFGRVYRGLLPGTAQTVAVKSVNKEVKEGIKEFVAEISSMGRMQHRNLVPLRGWCRNHKRLFLVYDFMSHGSLDKLLFTRRSSHLGWNARFHILKGVAAGLLYLHEQWDKCVVHRDIKSSNVLLDAEMNGRLGDFGLAKLYDHSENPETTRVVGTLGYIAPELLYSGKATPASDVYSYGVVLLEVATGRKPVDPGRDETEAILVDWMWDLYARERVMEAADPSLKGDYNEEEMKRVLNLGLSCCHPQPERRLTIRSVLQILEGQAELPGLSMPAMHSSMLGNTPRSGFFSISSDSKIDGFSTTSSRSPLQSNSETVSLL